MQEKLIILRKNKGVQQKELAEMLGITTTAYSLKENGKYQFTGDQMFKIAEYFKMPIEDIFLPRIHQNGVKE